MACWSVLMIDKTDRFSHSVVNPGGKDVMLWKLMYSIPMFCFMIPRQYTNFRTMLLSSRWRCLKRSTASRRNRVKLWGSSTTLSSFKVWQILDTWDVSRFQYLTSILRLTKERVLWRWTVSELLEVFRVLERSEILQVSQNYEMFGCARPDPAQRSPRTNETRRRDQYFWVIKYDIRPINEKEPLREEILIVKIYKAQYQGLANTLIMHRSMS